MFDTACVLGGSIAGLLAARVLSDFARRVVIIERDQLAGQAPRPGLPQGDQLHLLLPAGRQWLDRWLPGYLESAMHLGAIRITSEAQTYDGMSMAPSPRHYEMLSATRPLLESAVRGEVLAHTNISVKCARATGLHFRDGAVAGVEFTDPLGGAVMEVDFVVDAMGRSSRLPHWVGDAGFDRPRLERLALPINYATAVFESAEASANPDVAAMLSIFSPGNAVDGVSIASAAMVENDQWMACLIGCGADQPGRTVEEFRCQSAQVGPAFAAATAGPVSRDIKRYRQRESRRRHFTDLKNFPARLVCVGDAVVSFNPVYGQGMSSAALQASCLHTYLSDSGDFDAPAQEFFRLQQVVADAAWEVSTAGDRSWADFLGRVRIDASTRCQRWARNQILQAAFADSSIAELYHEVQYMLRHPSELARPAILEWAVAINSTAS
ncbi:hypothetical protein A5647_04905 [Mycobacterium sp. 1100029.7]|nr:hypothetical protein A5647_04905 [Mycobacterium sp. 1100029.7]